jgi:3',5'-cyclic-AMP phosphodiesterase
VDLTTVADDLVVLHGAGSARRFDGLQPSTDYTFAGIPVRTMARPPGELLCRVATVNDVHFGEIECGRIDDHPEGPIIRPEPGEAPYPETMNRGAAQEIAAIEPDAVIVKGDLSNDGTEPEWAAFEGCYRSTFGTKLHVVRGNHDAYRGQTRYAGDQRIDLPGVTIALLDTVVPGSSSGALRPEQIDWLDDLAAGADRPVIVMGHHQQWVDGSREPGYFGINPDDSDALTDVIARRTSIVAYTAGHTHRHRVRHLARAGGAPSIEIGCVKDFPGTWAEYRVYEGGISQVVHRISTPEALSWSERCRHLYRDFGIDYAGYALGTLDDRCFNIAPRSH